MGGIDLTFSGTEHSLHLLPLRHPASRFFRLLLSLRRIAFPPIVLSARALLSHSIPAGLPPIFARGYSPLFSASTRPSSGRPQRRTASNVKKLETEVVCLVHLFSRSTSLYSDFFFADLRSTEESRRGDGVSMEKIGTARNYAHSLRRLQYRV